jgi:steroid delta-isomerase
MTDPQRPGGLAQRALPEVIRYFETMTPETVREIGRIYAAGASFRDPFTEVEGSAAIGRIFAHMFERLESPRFVVREQMTDADRAFLVWDLEFRFPGARSPDLQRIHGASHLRFDADGRIAAHRDYWDAAEELYEKLPVLGALMRWLKRRAAA